MPRLEKVFMVILTHSVFKYLSCCCIIVHWKILGPLCTVGKYYWQFLALYKIQIWAHKSYFFLFFLFLSFQTREKLFWRQNCRFFMSQEVGICPLCCVPMYCHSASAYFPNILPCTYFLQAVTNDPCKMPAHSNSFESPAMGLKVQRTPLFDEICN